MSARAQRCARATIEYDGTAFAGSQVQPNARTVQGELEGALNRLIGERIRVRLAGRTDAGVHATGQVAALCLPRALPWAGGLPELRRRLNAVLPPDLAVRALRLGTARASIRGATRSGAFIAIGSGPGATCARSSGIGPSRSMAASTSARCARPRSGWSVSATSRALGSDAHGSTVRNLAEVRVTRRGELVEIRVTANAFLRRMVRGIVAILLEVGRGRLAPEAVTELLDRPGRALDGRAAPARGLTLERVIYPSARSTTERRTTNNAPNEGASQGMTGEQET